MVNFTNKTVILRSISSGFLSFNGNASGIVKYKSGNTEEISVTTLNLEGKDGRDYYLVFCDEDQNMKIFSLENPPVKKDFTIDYNFNCNNGFASLILFCENGKITPVLFGTILKETIKISSFTKAFEREINRAKTTSESSFLKDEQEISTLKKESQKNYEIFNGYDDEALADENYFEIQDFNKNNFTELKEDSFKNIDDKMDAFRKSYGEKEEENERLHRENAHCENEYQVESEKEKVTGNFENYENSTGPRKGESNCFYQDIEERLQNIFEKYQSFEGLTNIIPQSRWAKIPFGNDKFYLIGVAREQGKVAYIIYGVPGISDFKPKGFERYSVFLPENMFENTNKGYWCMFQSASDGSLKW